MLLQCKSFSHVFNKKYWQISDINVLNFNNTLTNDVVSFEQPGPVLAGDQWWPFFVTFLFLVTDILCLVIQYFGKIN